MANDNDPIHHITSCILYLQALLATKNVVLSRKHRHSKKWVANFRLGAYWRWWMKLQNWEKNGATFYDKSVISKNSFGNFTRLHGNYKQNESEQKNEHWNVSDPFFGYFESSFGQFLINSELILPGFIPFFHHFWAKIISGFDVWNNFLFFSGPIESEKLC